MAAPKAPTSERSHAVQAASTLPVSRTKGRVRRARGAGSSGPCGARRVS